MPVEKIEYVDENGETKVIDCYFKYLSNKDKSKGFIETCKNLGSQLPARVQMDQIREILSRHRAFQNESNSFHTFKVIVLHNLTHPIGYKTGDASE